jgi:hypothetical protein
MEGRRWADWWKAIAGNGKPPIHRPHFWTYVDTEEKTFVVDAIVRLDQNHRLEPEGTEVGPEIENFAYDHWNKSYSQTASQIILAQVFGSTNLNISLYDFIGNLPSDDPTRFDFLRQMKPVTDWLSERFPPSLQSRGIGILWRESASRLIQTDGTYDWETLCCPSKGWPYWLGAIGYGFQMADNEKINALAGNNAWANQRRRP